MAPLDLQPSIEESKRTTRCLEGAAEIQNSFVAQCGICANQGRFEWLAAFIRGFKREASGLQVDRSTVCPMRFEGAVRKERKADYVSLLREVSTIKH